jgi:hypothetical protein
VIGRIAVTQRRTLEPQPLPLFDAPPEDRSASRPLDTVIDDAPHLDPVDAHLAAARRLSRGIRRTRHRSPEQVRTGRLICRHLVAMLREAQT